MSLSLGDIENLTSKTILEEVYIDSYYFRTLQQFVSTNNYDERGEFFWLGSKKIRPFPLVKVGVIRRTNIGEIGKPEFELKVIELS